MGAADKRTLSPQLHGVLAPKFWRDHFPDLTISEALPSPVTPPAQAALDTIKKRVTKEGYFDERSPALERMAPRLAESVQKLVALGLPAPFLFVFDEPWNAFRAVDAVIAALLGSDFKMLPDFWAWHVDPKTSEAGWAPHRDRGRVALAPDGSPLAISLWIPLTEATPLNGCMYILPAHRDPVYNTASEHDRSAIDLASIRALPAKPGAFMAWNQAVLHWGAKSSPMAQAPRISMAVEFQRGDSAPMNEPLLDLGRALTFDQRLRLIAKQILQYQHLYPLKPETRAIADAIQARPVSKPTTS